MFMSLRAAALAAKQSPVKRDKPHRTALIVDAYNLLAEALPAAERTRVPLIEVIQAESRLKLWQAVAGGIHPEILYLAQIFWSRIHGLVMLEITHKIPSFLDDPAELFRRELNTLLIQYL
jgi:hypothetical protein